MARIVTRQLRLGLRETAESWLEIQENVVPWEGTLAGTLHLRGLKSIHRLTEPVLAMLTSRSDDQHQVLGSERIIPQPLSIAVGELLEFPFGLEVPWGTPFRHEVRLDVNLRSGVWHQGHEVKVHPVPPAGCTAAVELFAEVARMRVERWELTYDAHIGAVLAPVSDVHALRSAVLRLLRVESDWYGDLTLHLRSRWPRRPVVLGVPFVQPHPERARDQFRALLTQAGVEPWRLADLPLPSQPPELDAASLPRIAAPDGTQPDTLPRAAEPVDP